MHRRELVATLAGLPAVALAGCGGSGGDGGAEETASATPTEATESETPTEPTESGTPTEAPTDTATDTPTETPAPTETPTATPEPADQVVEVGAGDGFDFAPESFAIEVGDTVRWEWVGSNHNVVVESAPEDSDWAGEADGTYDAGHTHAHTFEAAGRYEYYCAPHRSVGMEGSFEVE